mgnify:CR=1 FL=1
MERYGIIGFGCAGYHGAQSLRANGFAGEIHVYTDTGAAPENPMLTTYVTAGRLPETGGYPFGTLEEIRRRLDLEIHARRVEHVDPRSRTVTAGGSAQAYDKLLLATGAKAFVPPVAGADSPNAYTMRTMRDARRLRERLGQGGVRSAVVVGASMVGIKVVELLIQGGVDCTLSDLAPHIFPLAAFASISEEIERRLTQRGVKLAFGQGLAGLEDLPEGGVRVQFSGGGSQDCDLAVLCIGTRPNLDYLEPDTLTMGRGGIRVDETMASSQPGVYAAGDCAEHLNIQSGQPQAVGLWANAGRQGDVAGASMAGRAGAYEGSLVHNITHFMDMDFISLGDKSLGGDHKVFSRKEGGLWLEALVKDGRPTCINILDCHEISGMIKGLLMKQIRGGARTDPFLAEKLRRSGVDEAFIKLAEGSGHD